MFDRYRSSVIILFVLAVSCGKTVEQRLQAIDGMQGVLTNVMLTSEEISDIQIEQYIKDIDKKVMRIEYHLIPDSMDMDDKSNIEEFNSLTDRLQNSLTTKAQLVESVKQTRLKLADLRTDVQNHLWPEDSLNLYLDIEFQYVMEIDEKMEQAVAQVNGCFQTYEQINPRIEKLLADKMVK